MNCDLGHAHPSVLCQLHVGVQLHSRHFGNLTPRFVHLLIPSVVFGYGGPSGNAPRDTVHAHMEARAVGVLGYP